MLTHTKSCRTDKIKKLALEGDSIAAMIYIHHQLEKKDTISVDSLLKEKKNIFRFSLYGKKTCETAKQFLDKEDVVFFLADSREFQLFVVSLHH